MRLTSLLLASSLIAAPFAATAAPWTIDKSHTTIGFSINHLGFSTTNGIFTDYDAEIDFDPENIEASSVNFTIKAESINTFWDARDAHIRTGDFLNVAEHPEITFVSTSVTKTGDNTADLTGDLTIVGVTNSVTFATTLNQIGPNPFNPEATVAGFDLQGVIDRTDFGVGYGAPAIGAEMPISISLEIAPAQ